MIIKQFHLDSLGHASYFIGSEETGEAFVLDIRRDINPYLEEARHQGMSIAYALETHQHNDYVTGICELADRINVQCLAGQHAALGYEARPMADGERLSMGEVEFQILHTPGHTPEHISVLVTDRSRGEDPVLLLSGGALLVGDVARPDLLGGPEEASRHAEVMCRMLQEKILTLPDFVEVYPTHVSGSLCGGNIGSRLSTTIGYERRMNPVLAKLDHKDHFVKQCLDLKHLPGVPPYWPRMRKINTEGPPILGSLPEPPALTPNQFDRQHQEGAIIVDCRQAEAFTAHIPDALNVGLGSSFATWAGTVIPEDSSVLLVLDKPDDLWEVTWQLLRVGYPPPAGWLAGGMFAWRTAAKPLHMLPQWSVWDLQQHLQKDSDLEVLDVRQPGEWGAGHIQNARFITGSELPKRIHEIGKNRQIAVICGSGYRSSVLASFLQHHGYRNIVNVLGGMSAWKEASFPIVKD
ncbi:MAG: MBL fold metallo-hydrolase [Nitrospira sp.]|nr:MBL fold metallo-hydrolase [Nitrospira sp.]HBP86774.1 MBL fold metallo-hydrolase [Nitrospiraceae bacterium]HNP27777.1 MBL fold metallo-hydrolase [Nitrospirales bacterium]